jgi:hypothetical protein
MADPRPRGSYVGVEPLLHSPRVRMLALNATVMDNCGIRLIARDGNAHEHQSRDSVNRSAGQFCGLPQVHAMEGSQRA